MVHCSGVYGTGRPHPSHETPLRFYRYSSSILVPGGQGQRVCVCLRMLRADSCAASCRFTTLTAGWGGMPQLPVGSSALPRIF